MEAVPLLKLADEDGLPASLIRGDGVPTEEVVDRMSEDCTRLLLLDNCGLQLADSEIAVYRQIQT